MTEKDKMLAGQLYDPNDEELTLLRQQAHQLSFKYNQTQKTDIELRTGILQILLPNAGNGSYLQGPIQFDYGIFTYVGENFYANFNLTVLDCCSITIGDNVLIGPNCCLTTAMHPLLSCERNPQQRNDGSFFIQEYAKPIIIGSNCWIASNVTICGGVTIGDHCVIGAGSVVTRDIPSYSLAAGVPCKFIRKITEKDSIQFNQQPRRSTSGALFS